MLNFSGFKHVIEVGNWFETGCNIIIKFKLIEYVISNKVWSNSVELYFVNLPLDILEIEFTKIKWKSIYKN